MSSNPASVVQQGKQRAATSAVEDQTRKTQSDSDSGSDSSFDEADDQDWADWVDDEDEGQARDGKAGFKVPTLALFPDQPGSKELKQFDDAQPALAHAKSLGCDFVGVVAKLSLDPLQVIRLLNHLRRIPGTLSPKDVSQLSGKEAFLDSDEELMPVKGAEQDGLLRE
jgi:type I protein arginine methyltransferase